MSGLITVLQPGFGTTIQDGGRFGHRHEGMPVSGWLNAPLAEAANALLGNPMGDAVLELRGAGTELQVQTGPVRLAMTGDITARWIRADGQPTLLPAWQTATLLTGDRLVFGMANSGCACLALSGGIQIAPVLGSRSSYWRAGLPGLLGRPLQPGDALPCSTTSTASPKEWRTRHALELPQGPLRVMPGPQAEHFTSEAIAQFLDSEWRASAEQDRMGLRLQGPALQHASPASADIVSDAVAPGTIQVPGSGQPIVLMADSQTVGGYPKIATIIRADLPRLAHLRAGTALRFQAVDASQARQALLDQQARWQAWLNTRETFIPPGFVDEEALCQNNLISGMLRADP